tara:strand:+ start:1132 stop:1452 length:321 start_codon:yes stop_codon:yes gene_type:complete
MSEENTTSQAKKPISETTKAVIEILESRDAISLSKYAGQTMDRDDLTAAQWARHLIEELADGIKYAVRMERGLLLLDSAREIIGVSSSPQASEWLDRYDEQFGETR